MLTELSLLGPAYWPLLALSFFAVLGLVIGSFLNVVIYRVPAGLSVVSPRSACPRCQTAIRARDNIPVLSWLLLRGRCRDCAAPISARYPAVELATGALFALVAGWALTQAPALLPLWLYLAAAGVALFMIDVDTMRLPDQIVKPSYVVVAAGLVTAGVLAGEWPVTRVGVCALIWLLTFAIPWLVTTGRGMGFGDVKLAPLLGAALGAVGYGEALVGLMSGFLIGAVVAPLLMLVKGGKRKIPYGPYMLTGALVGLLFGGDAWTWYLTFTGVYVG